jgi:hypothetical protein
MVSTRLNAGPAIDPVYAAMEAVNVTRARLNEICDRLEDAEHLYRRHVDTLPKPDHEGVMFTSRDEVDKHFDRADDKRAIALAIRDKLAAAAGMGDLAERFNPPEEASDVRAAREAARALTHKHMTVYLRCKDELRRTSGLADADRAYGITATALSKAEDAAFATIPTTLAGAGALAAFAADYCEMDTNCDGPVACLRSIAAFISRSA